MDDNHTPNVTTGHYPSNTLDISNSINNIITKSSASSISRSIQPNDSIHSVFNNFGFNNTTRASPKPSNNINDTGPDVSIDDDNTPFNDNFNDLKSSINQLMNNAKQSITKNYTATFFNTFNSKSLINTTPNRYYNNNTISRITVSSSTKSRTSPPEFQSTSPRPTDSYSSPEVTSLSSAFPLHGASSNYRSLKSIATPGDRGGDGSSDWTSSGLPGSDLRELEGEVNREAVCKMTSGGGAPCNGKEGVVDKTSSGIVSDLFLYPPPIRSVYGNGSVRGKVLDIYGRPVVENVSNLNSNVLTVPDYMIGINGDKRSSLNGSLGSRTNMSIDEDDYVDRLCDGFIPQLVSTYNHRASLRSSSSSKFKPLDFGDELPSDNDDPIVITSSSGSEPSTAKSKASSGRGRGRKKAEGSPSTTKSQSSIKSIKKSEQDDDDKIGFHLIDPEELEREMMSSTDKPTVVSGKKSSRSSVSSSRRSISSSSKRSISTESQSSFTRRSNIDPSNTPPRPEGSSRPEVGLADSPSIYLSLKSTATPGDRGDDEDRIGPRVEVEPVAIYGSQGDVNREATTISGREGVVDATSSGIPVADLREAEGEVNRRGSTPSGKTSSGEADGRTISGGNMRGTVSEDPIIITSSGSEPVHHGINIPLLSLGTNIKDTQATSKIPDSPIAPKPRRTGPTNKRSMTLDKSSKNNVQNDSELNTSISLFKPPTKKVHKKPPKVLTPTRVISEYRKGNLTNQEAIDAVIRYRVNSMLHKSSDKMFIDKSGDVRIPKGYTFGPSRDSRGKIVRKSGLTRIEREILAYQKSTHLLIPRSIFARVVREIAQSWYKGEGQIKFTVEALTALQAATEDEITRILEISTACSHHAKRITLRIDDMRLARFCRGRQQYEFFHVNK